MMNFNLSFQIMSRIATGIKYSMKIICLRIMFFMEILFLCTGELFVSFIGITTWHNDMMTHFFVQLC